MVYRITVDGKRKYAEAAIKEYSLETDNLAREKIIRHFLDERNAQEVVFDTSHDEAREIHNIAKDFYLQLLEFEKVWKAMPYDHPWGVDEFEKLIPEYMKIYMKAMRLPYLEWLEDKEEDDDSRCDFCKRETPLSIEEKYTYYRYDLEPYDEYGYCEKSGYETTKGVLWDDFGDIRTDLAEGVKLYRAGLIYSAVFEWRHGLLIHYGNHITSALRAMCSAWEYHTSHINRDEDDYWNFYYESKEDD